MPKRIVCISGIGADRRAFSKLEIGEAFQIDYADWLPLIDRNEPFPDYCRRMITAYRIRKDDAILGLSFGGLIGQYIAKELGNAQVVLISSFRNKQDLRPLMKVGMDLRLHRTLPSFRIPVISDITAFVLNSFETESRKLIKDMLMDADFHFIKWAIHQIDSVDLKS